MYDRLMIGPLASKEGINSMKTPLTRKRLMDHLSYSWWKYALLISLAMLCWSVLYSVTRYRPPEDKKVVMGAYAMGRDAVFNEYAEQVRQLHLPEMEEVTVELLPVDDTQGAMVLSTRMVARECDIYLLPKSYFQNYAAEGAFQPLEQCMPELVAYLESLDISLSRGWRTNAETREKHLYGIPCAALPGLTDFLLIDPAEYYLSVFFATGNDENVYRFMDAFVRDMLAPPPATPTDLTEGA